MRTIDVTPTWSGVIRLLISGVENGNEEAREELIRLARLYDGLCDHIEEFKTHAELKGAFSNSVMVRIPRDVWESL